MVLFAHKRSGFTLAEVLITLGIIGVVAAMTIPNLMTSISKRQVETHIKANFSIIKQTLRFAEADGLSYDMAITDGSDESMKLWFETYMAPHLKVEQICYNQQGCWHKAGIVKSLTGGTPRYENNNGIGGNIITFKIANGSMFNIDGNTASDMASFGLDTTSDGMTFYFDANGEKKPNRIGKDIYIMVWSDQGLVPAGYNRTKAEVATNCLNGDGYFCLQHVVNNGWTIAEKAWRR